MTIDERLDRLTERHEALTQSVELLSIEVRKMTDESSTTRRNIDALVLSMRDLVSVVRAHERRITGIEGQLEA
jgi:archaellum component FlaC